jgi:hypothetical protein
MKTKDEIKNYIKSLSDENLDRNIFSIIEDLVNFAQCKDYRVELFANVYLFNEEDFVQLNIEQKIRQDEKPITAIYH